MSLKILSIMSHSDIYSPDQLECKHISLGIYVLPKHISLTISGVIPKIILCVYVSCCCPYVCAGPSPSPSPRAPEMSTEFCVIDIDDDMSPNGVIASPSCTPPPVFWSTKVRLPPMRLTVSALPSLAHPPAVTPQLYR